MSSIPSYIDEIHCSTCIHYHDEDKTNIITQKRIVLIRNSVVNVGDKVIIINNDGNENFFNIGEIFTVNSIYSDDSYWVTSDRDERLRIGKKGINFCAFKIKEAYEKAL